VYITSLENKMLEVMNDMKETRKRPSEHPRRKPRKQPYSTTDLLTPDTLKKMSQKQTQAPTNPDIFLIPPAANVSDDKNKLLEDELKNILNVNSATPKPAKSAQPAPSDPRSPIKTQITPTKNINSSQRFAGPASSPAPSSLPLPTFGSSFESPADIQSSDTELHSAPASSKRLQPRQLFKNETNHRSLSTDDVLQQSSLSYMSNEIKSMLNIENS
jgi:hypothetical protein